MAHKIRRAEYYHTIVRDRPGEAYKILASLATVEVNLLAFGAVPLGPDRAQLTLFPDSIAKLAEVAEGLGLTLEGPHPAILVQGDDRLGALADVHGRLADESINVFASTGVTDGAGSYGYVLYVRPEEIDAACAALGA
jgi:predicted amino acid-binding ACT domain protein